MNNLKINDLISIPDVHVSENQKMTVIAIVKENIYGHLDAFVNEGKYKGKRIMCFNADETDKYTKIN